MLDYVGLGFEILSSLLLLVFLLLVRKICVTSFLKRHKVVLGKYTEQVFMEKQPSKRVL